MNTLLLTLLLTFLFFSCENSTKKGKEKVIKHTELSSDNGLNETQSDFNNNLDNINGKFRILKVDSISDIYMIYGVKSEKYYKILSNKNDSTNKNWERLKINKEYELVLESEYSQYGLLEHVSGVSKEDGPVIYFEGDSIKHLYISPNIKSLYYNPEYRNN